MNCRDATQLASRGMDTQLGLAEQLLLWGHLGTCRHCARFRRQMTTLRALGAAYAKAGPRPPADPADAASSGPRR
ncbi:anti-sigma factor family protein [Derxia lacustris]|uniref:anti-sigma factor family protein n=1 Tax=Derxia lacustris TaxID=764842 RepID=UPI001593A57E|nr:zf-HC2 domain-containing protein [Derxia lacustris]